MVSRLAILLSCFLTVPLTNILAQGGQRGGFNIADHLLIRESRYFRGEASEEKYEGSPYLNDSLRVTIVYTKDQKFNPVTMRYNISEDVMEYHHRGVTYLLDPDPRITRIEMGSDVFVVRDLQRRATNPHGYLQLLEDGKLKLLSKKVVNYRQAVPTQGIPAKYSRQPDMLFLQLDDAPPVKAGSVKQIIESLPDKHEEMAQFVKSEKISGRDKDDLAKFVRYYNSLAAAN